MYAQPANIEALEQVPQPSIERAAQNPVTHGLEIMPEGFAIQRDPRPLAKISFNQPHDEISPGLRRAVDGAVARAFIEDTTPEATSSDQLQDCVNEALGGLKIKKGNYTAMVYPGDKRKQITGTEGRLKTLSPGCLPLVSRATPSLSFEMQRPNNHKAHITSKAQPMVNDSVHEIVDGNGGGTGGAYIYIGRAGDGRVRDKKFRYHCTPGNGVTHVNAVYKLQVNSATDGHKLGAKTYSTPVKIVPVPNFSTVQGGGVRRAC
jgi:hypothetical protein